MRAVWMLVAVLACGDDDDDARDAEVVSDAGVDAALDAAVPDAAPDAATGCGGLRREPIATDLRWPVFATAPAGDDRIFVVERLDGRVIVLDDAGVANEAPFLDVSSAISVDGYEAGLLYLAFHPDFADNGRVYVSYTTQDETLRIARFEVPPDTPDRVDPDSEALVIELPAPSHHNVAGVMAFGPDGLLYIGAGDNNVESDSQDLASYHGKILRIDVGVDDAPYAVPPDNPFVEAAEGLPEIWSWGLREPYRFSFDAETGALYIADVGGDFWEELDVVAPSSEGGLDFGWPVMEGNDCRVPPVGCETAGVALPDYQYAHDGVAAAILGGGVYRGAGLGECWQGRYFFGDYPGAWIRSLRWDAAAGVTDIVDHADLLVDGEPPFVSLGRDGHGEILIVGEDSLDRIVAAED